MTTEPTDECVCGADADHEVVVIFADGPTRFSYCLGCADDVVTFVEGAYHAHHGEAE